MGELVYLKLQPHVQTLVASRCNHQLSFRFFGPFKICSGLALLLIQAGTSSEAQIHPVVHVSQLKRHIPAHVPVSTDRSSVSTDPKEPTAPVMVVQHAHKAIGGAVSP